MKKLRKPIVLLLLLTFCSSLLCQSPLMAQTAPMSQPGTMVGLSQSVSHPVLRGVKVDPNNPLRLEFIIDTPNNTTINKEDFDRLVGYFMAVLTVPEKDFWVNLSPYEQDRIINPVVEQTSFGRELLTQDYLLKQLAASLTHPESETGKAYWSNILGNGGTANNFNKVWIVPEKAEIYENGNVAYLTQASLKVLTDEDYLAAQKNGAGMIHESPAIQSFKKNILPKIDQDVNNGENFTQLRQMYCSFLLASWFKSRLKESLYKYYINQNKVQGIDLADKNIKEKIYNQYIEAFKTGAYNYIKKERVQNKITKRQYFSGGVGLGSGAVGAFGTTTKVTTDSSAVALSFAYATGRGMPKDLSSEQVRAMAERALQRTVVVGEADVVPGDKEPAFGAGGEQVALFADALTQNIYALALDALAGNSEEKLFDEVLFRTIKNRGFSLPEKIEDLNPILLSISVNPGSSIIITHRSDGYFVIRRKSASGAGKVAGTSTNFLPDSDKLADLIDNDPVLFDPNKPVPYKVVLRLGKGEAGNIHAALKLLEERGYAKRILQVVMDNKPGLLAENELSRWLLGRPGFAGNKPFIVLRPGLSPEDIAWALRHDNEEAGAFEENYVEYEASATEFHITISEVAHVIQSAQEGIAWIQAGEKGIMQAHYNMLSRKKDDARYLRGITEEDRTVQNDLVRKGLKGNVEKMGAYEEYQWRFKGYALDFLQKNVAKIPRVMELLRSEIVLYSSGEIAVEGYLNGSYSLNNAIEKYAQAQGVDAYTAKIILIGAKMAVQYGLNALGKSGVEAYLAGSEENFAVQCIMGDVKIGKDAVLKILAEAKKIASEYVSSAVGEDGSGSGTIMGKAKDRILPYKQEREALRNKWREQAKQGHIVFNNVYEQAGKRIYYTLIDAPWWLTADHYMDGGVLRVVVNKKNLPPEGDRQYHKVITERIRHEAAPIRGEVYWQARPNPLHPEKMCNEQSAHILSWFNAVIASSGKLTAEQYWQLHGRGIPSGEYVARIMALRAEALDPNARWQHESLILAAYMPLFAKGSITGYHNMSFAQAQEIIEGLLRTNRQEILAATTEYSGADAVPASGAGKVAGTVYAPINKAKLNELFRSLPVILDPQDSSAFDGAMADGLYAQDRANLPEALRLLRERGYTKPLLWIVMDNVGIVPANELSRWSAPLLGFAGSKPFIILRRGLSVEEIVWALTHDSEEAAAYGQNYDRYQFLAKEFGVTKEEIAHIAQSAKEAIAWINSKKDGLMPVHEAMLQSKRGDEAYYDGILQDNRQKQKAILDRLRFSGADIEKYDAYQARFKERAEGVGGIALETNIILKSGSKAIDIKVTPQMIEMMKNSARVSYKVVTVGEQHPLKEVLSL